MLKITVTQASIEQAVREYVLKQLVNQDQDVEVILAATRGADGITAEVNVGTKPASDDPRIGEGITQETVIPPSSSTTKKKEPALAQAVYSEEVKPSPEKEPEVEKAPATPVEAEPTAPWEEDEKAPEPANEPVKEEEYPVEEAPVAKPTSNSLFAGLTRPNNAE